MSRKEMNIQVKIGNRIKEIREKQGLTQNELSIKTDINRTFLIHMEKGRKNISIQTLQKVIIGFDVPFKYFFRDL